MANLKSIWTETTDEETGEVSQFQELVPIVADDLMVAVTREHINSEARSRIQQLLGAESHDEAIIKQLNLAAEYARLQGLPLERTDDEIAGITAIAKTHAEIKRIIAVSNELSQSPPSDFSKDRHWIEEINDE